MFLFVEPTALYQIISISSITALIVTVLNKLSKTCPCTNRIFFAFTVSLPETYVIGEFVGMIIKPLFTLLCTPDANTVFNEPLYNEWGFIGDASNTVKHKNKQNIKLTLLSMFLYNLQLVSPLGTNFMAGNTIFLFLMNNRPVLFFGKTVTSFSLHRRSA